MTSLHERTEIYKAGWARGFYDCSNAEEMNSGGPDRDEWLAEYWSGYFDGRAARRGQVPVKLSLEPTGIPELDFSFTLEVLRQFARGSSIESVAGEMKTSASRVEIRLRGAFAAIFRFLAERSEAFKSPAANNFEKELLALAFSFRPNDRRNKAA